MGDHHRLHHCLRIACEQSQPGDSHALVVAIIAGAATLLAAIVTGGLTYWSMKRDRRRDIYSGAVKAAVGWNEMVYRVRRRQAGSEEALLNRFHDLQDEIAYHEAWIGSESADMADGYRRLVASIKKKTQGLINEAWDQPVRPATGRAPDDETHPDIQQDVDEFLADVRAHLSLAPWRRPVRR